MVSLTLTSPRSSIILPSSKNIVSHVPPPPLHAVSVSPAPSPRSSSSSDRLSRADDEDITVTFKRASIASRTGERSTEDLRLLAVSTHMTELSYAISDIQTRIFEIQELRHKSQSSGDATSATTVIDESLVNLDERVQSVEHGLKTISDSLQPLQSRAERTPTSEDTEAEEEQAVLRKHAALVADWEAVKGDVQVLREELKEDKWLTVFRTVTDQADGMMSSLEKAVQRCQDVTQRGWDEGITPSYSSSSIRSERSPLTYDTFMGIVDSYEAKKKHYMPATTKVLSIIDKGVQDRVTKNGECLRRHAECTQRWHNLKGRIARTDSDIENLRRVILQSSDSALSSDDSSQSALTSVSKSGFLATPPSEKKGRSPSHTISRSISPFRKIARKLRAAGSGVKSPSPGKVTPVPSKSPALSRMPSSEPTRTLRHRTSMFNFLHGQPPTPTTPSHKHTSSLTPDTSPSRKAETNGSVKRPVWNSSTRVEDERGGTVKQSPRRPSISGRPRYSEELPPLPQTRSVSRASISSSRPLSPVTSSASTAYSSKFSSLFSQAPPLPVTNPTPRARPKTPSHIPTPSARLGRSSDELSPTLSTFDGSPGARPPSHSMIPIPSVHVSSASRPGTAMSYRRPDSAMSFRGSAQRVQTPDALRMTPRPRQAPPSSFTHSVSPRTPGSRPASRAGAETPKEFGEPQHPYVLPKGEVDALDREFEKIVNSYSHNFDIRRVDAPSKKAQKGEELRGQYTFIHPHSTKTISVKLTPPMTRSGKDTTQKVLCRVGGGWMDLREYIRKSPV